MPKNQTPLPPPFSRSFRAGFWLPKTLLLATAGCSVAAIGLSLIFLNPAPNPAETPPPALHETVNDAEAAQNAAAEAERKRQIEARIAHLETEIRAQAETHLRADAIRFGLALRDLQTILDEYETGADPFVEDLHSFSGKWKLYAALGRDLSSMPGKAFRETGQALENRANGSLWQAARTGELLHCLEAARTADYGFARMETVVDAMWRKSFDERVDLAARTAARIERLLRELEASRNQLALQINAPLHELLQLKEMSPISVHDWLDRRIAAEVSTATADLVPPVLAAGPIILVGGEIAAYQVLKITRHLANRSALLLAQRMAESAAARAGAAAATALGSGWATFGIGVGVAVVIEIAANEVSERQMKSALREQLQDFRRDFWTGSDESPGIHPQLTTAFLDYQSRFIAAFENPGEIPADPEMPAIAQTAKPVATGNLP